jgi:hypothetical protein
MDGLVQAVNRVSTNVQNLETAFIKGRDILNQGRTITFQ